MSPAHARSYAPVDGDERTPSVSSRAERWLLYALFLTLPINTHRVWGALGFLTLFDWILLPLLLLWGTRKLANDESFLFPSAFRRPLTILMLGALLSTLFATNPLSSLFGILIFLRFYVFFRVALDTVTDSSQLRILVGMLAIGLVFSAALGVAQGVFDVHFTFGDVELNQNTTASIAGQQVVRTIGTFANSLNFANYVAVTLFCLLIARPLRTAPRIALVMLVCLAGAALLQTLSRGPILAAVLGGLAYVAVGAGARSALRLVVAAAAVLALIVLPVFGSRITQSVLGESLFVRFAAVVEQYEGNVRYGLWLESAKSLDSHIVGVGLRNSDYRLRWPRAAMAIPHYFPYETRSWKPFNFHFENVYLAAYMNIGLIGFIGWVALVGQAIRVPWQRLRASPPGRDWHLARVLLAAILTFAVNMITNPAILSDLRIMVLFWALLACVAILQKVVTPAEHEAQVVAVVS